MKVCQILASSGSGGLSKHVIELSNALSMNECEVHALTPCNFSEQFSKEVRHRHFHSHKTLSSYLDTLKLFKTLKDIDPDIVHAHGNTASIQLARVKPFIRAKCVGTIHWNLKRKKNRRGFEKMDGVIGVSPNTLKDLENKSSTVIYNGTASPELATTPSKSSITDNYNLNPDWPLAIAIGRLVRGKGFDLLIDAWNNIDASLLIIGEGPEKSALESQLISSGLDDRIRITGAIPNAAAMMGASELTPIASHSEGFSYVLAESLLYRTPVISTRVNGSEVLPASAVVPTGDVEKLNEKITQFFKNSSEITLGYKSVFDWAEAELSITSMTNNILSYYKTL